MLEHPISFIFKDDIIWLENEKKHARIIYNFNNLLDDHAYTD